MNYADTPAALIRGGGLAGPAPVAGDMSQAERLEARRLFRETHADAIVICEELRDRGWTGAWITIGQPLIPAELRPLYAARQAAEARQGVYAPGGGDAVFTEMQAEARARYDAAQARLEAMNGHVALPPGVPR